MQMPKSPMSNLNGLLGSVATLLLWKVLDFRMKKHYIHKKTLDYKHLTDLSYYK